MMRALLLSVLFFPTVHSVLCPSGFSSLNNKKCVRLFRNSLKHQEAESDCRFFGGTLVTIKNAIDNRVVVNTAGMAGLNTLWIGSYCYANQNETSCYYDDNSGKNQYSNFAKGFPVVDHPYGGCVYLTTSGPNSGQWMSAKCEVVGMPFMCEVPLTSADNQYCRHNYDGHCYYPSHEMPSNFTRNSTEGRSFLTCSIYFDAFPLSIHSMREVDYVKSLFQNSQISHISLGAEAELPDTFYWQDGSNWDFSYMNPIAASTGKCLQMDVKTGMWKESDCNDSTYFVCKRRTSTMGESLSESKASEKEPKKVDAVGDFSQCNTTLYLAPGTITSWDYPNHNSDRTSCTWRIATLGPYRLAIYFTDGYTYYPITVQDEYGNGIYSGNMDNHPVTVVAPTNVATVFFQSSGFNRETGFSATILPL